LFVSFFSLWAFLALPRFDRCRLSFALKLRFLVYTLTTKREEIVRIVVELVVFVFAAVRGLFPETVARFIDPVDFAIANNEVITTLLLFTQLSAFFNSTCLERS